MTPSYLTLARREVVPPEPPPELLFRSTWETATGSTDNAISDGGFWNVNFCAADRANVLNVLDGDALGWTKTANVLSVRTLGEACAQFQLPTPSVIPASTSHYVRMYYRVDATTGSNNHPFTYNCCGDIQLVPWSRYSFPGGYSINIATDETYPYNKWGPGTLGVSHDLQPYDTWFRYEWYIEYLTAMTLRIYPRIYSLAGALLYDADTWFQQDYTGTGYSLTDWYANGGVINITDVDLARLLGGGNEGPFGAPDTGEYYYFADIAVSLTNWVGDA
jgi:hypothetical protein